MNIIFTTFLLVTSGITLTYATTKFLFVNGKLFCGGIPYEDATVSLYKKCWYCWFSSLKKNYYFSKAPIKGGVISFIVTFFPRESTNSDLILEVEHKCNNNKTEYRKFFVENHFIGSIKENPMAKHFGNIELLDGYKRLPYAFNLTEEDAN